MKQKSFIDRASYELGRVLSLFRFLGPFIKAINSVYYRIYTGYISRCFKSFGSRVLIAPMRELKGAKCISIGDGVIIGKNITMTVWKNDVPGIDIGARTRIGENAHITCINHIVIGKDVLTGRNLLITDNAHGNRQEAVSMIPPIKRHLISKGEVFIGDGVWMGDNVCILPGVNIGNNSIIGANAVVSKDVPAFSVVVGASCRIISM